MIKKLLVWTVLLVLIVLVGAYFTRNTLVAKAITTGSEYALGTAVELGSASLAIGAGSLEIDGYAVHNPEGFEPGNFFEIKHGAFDVATGSLLDEEVRIDSVILEGVTLTLEQINQNGNYRPILDHIRSVDFGESSKSDSKFRIDKIALRDVSVDASLELLGKPQYQKSFSLDNFEIGNVGSDGGATVGQVSAIVMRAVVSRALDKAKGELPGGFGQPLQEQLQEKLDEVKDDAKNKLEDKIKDVGGSLLGGGS
ncbi:hypothetical protein KQH51_03320 [bacterium]|nr:hypothetical protein [bacterium]MCB2201953.1 hypothetical protein [bacterium]